MESPVKGGSRVTGLVGDTIYSQDGNTIAKLKLQFFSTRTGQTLPLSN